MSEPIDWVEISRKIGQNKPPIYSSSNAMLALEQIIGEDVLRQAVSHYVAWKPERELTRQVLWRLRPWSAMQRCYEIYRSDADREDRRAAVELLDVVGDERVLDWIDEFLADPDEWIQQGAVNILDQMLFGGGIRYNEPAMEKVDRLLASAKTHPNFRVRQGIASLLADEERRRRPGGRWRRSRQPGSRTAKGVRRKDHVVNDTAIECGR